MPDKRRDLTERLAAYLDSDAQEETIASLSPAFMKSSGEFDAVAARMALKGEVSFSPSNIVRYPFKPFDVRLAYLSSDIAPLFSRPSPQLLELRRIPGQRFFITRERAHTTPEGPPFYFSSLVCDYDSISGHARHFPTRLRAASSSKPKKKDDGNGEFGSILHEAAPARDAGSGKTTANLSPAARAYLAKLGIKNPDADADTAALIWLHALAIGYAPAYLSENADGIRQDWPRIPLPSSKAALLASAELGRQVAALLDTETPVPGVTAGKLRPELQTVAELHSTGSPDFRVTAGWGHAGKEGVTMPGKGKKLTRGYRTEEEPERPLLDLLGKSTHDIYLNDTAYWRNVPEKVWDCTIGGYQVLKKWLSYREHTLLGRAITAEEAREITHTARRLASLILLQPELDANYQRVKAASHDWKT